MANRKILFKSDNITVVEVIKNQCSKEKNLMHLIRLLVFVSLSIVLYYIFLAIIMYSLRLSIFQANTMY